MAKGERRKVDAACGGDTILASGDGKGNALLYPLKFLKIALFLQKKAYTLVYVIFFL